MPDPTVIDRLAADPALAPLRRSLDTAYRDPARAAAMDTFYSRFVRPGDLVVDVGAHVGDRTACFRRLGADVVAVEPQPDCVRVLRALFDGDHAVTVVPAACGATPGETRLHVNSANPMVSTASAEFVAAARGAPGWEGEVWDAERTVPVTTLEALVDAYGTPAFVKIDVEGTEDEVLAGLLTPVPALSFEFTTIRREAALRALEQVAALGPYRFDLSLGETFRMSVGAWVPAEHVADRIRALPHHVNSGDIYSISQTG